MNKIQSLSIEALLDQLEDLSDQRDEGKDYLLDRITMIQTELIKKIKADPQNEYTPSLKKIQKELVVNLVDYGTYLKTEYQKDDVAAKNSLLKALRCDVTIPRAYYRLGFLAYKEEKYTDAVQLFQRSIDYQEKFPNHYMTITKQQMYYATLYMSHSALYIAAYAQEKIKDLSREPEVENNTIEKLMLSPLYELIDSNTRQLAEHVYQFTDCNGQRGGSMQEYEEFNEAQDEKVLRLDMVGIEHCASFGKKFVRLTYMNAMLLKKLMIESSETKPLKKDDLDDIFTAAGGAIKVQTYIKNISRLREKLEELDLPCDVIETITKTERNQEIAYYYRFVELPFLLAESTASM